MEFSRQVNWDFWWDVAQKCSYATFFHTPVWQRFALETMPQMEDATVGFRLENSTRAVFPLLRTRGIGPLQDLISSYSFCYGGIIADGPLSQEDVDRLYKTVTSWPTMRLQVIQNPFSELCTPKIDLQTAPGSTRIVHLNRSFDEIFANFSRSHRNNYRKGLKRGVEVRIAESLEHYEMYYEVFNDSIRRWESSGEDTPNSSWDLFKKGFNISRDHPDLMKLWVAFADNKVIAGAWIFYWNQHVVYWHGATLEEYFKHQPSVVLHTEIIKDAVARNFAYYDFNPSGSGLGGVAEFKRRFGTTELPVNWWKFGDQKFNLLRKIAQKFR